MVVSVYPSWYFAYIKQAFHYLVSVVCKDIIFSNLTRNSLYM